MTHPFLNDPKLRNLPAMVDEDAMIALVSACLERHAGIKVVGCDPRYIRYKPQTSCLVQYDITFMGASGTESTVCAHVKSFSDDRAKRRAASRKLDKIVSRAERRESDLPYDQATFIPELNGLLQFFPVDYDLPFLVQAASANEMNRTLQKASPAIDAEIVDEPELIRYKPGRKALFRYHIERGPAEYLYGKIHADNRAERLRRQTAALIDAGIHTPPVIASLSDHGFLAHAGFPGLQLASMRGTDEHTLWMPPLAQELHRLHQTTIPDATPHTLTDEAARIHETTSMLGIIAPHLGPRRSRISDEIASRLAGIEDVLATNHGDFYDDQVVVSGSGLSIIDLDELRLAHPLLDIGNMLAHLRLGEQRGEGIGPAYEAFRGSALEQAAYSESDLALFEAISLIKLAPGPFRRLEDDWPQGIEQILGLSEECLAIAQSRSPGPMSSGHPKTEPHTSTAITDDALPQLMSLQDIDAMSARFTEALGDDVAAIENIHIVRHKAGRRAILRYDLASGAQLFGKTFASKRGPRVEEITRAITSARAFGPFVALPDPLAWFPDLKLILQRSVAGTSIEPSLLEGDSDLARRIAALLHHFHNSGLDLGRRHNLAKELSPLEQRSREVGELFPDLQELAHACLAQSLERRQEHFPWRDRPVHRDFYHDQVLIHEGALAVLDLDDAAMSEPTVDVANFATHLMLLAYQKPDHAGPLDRVRSAFLERYHQLDNDLDTRLLRFLTATTLLRLAGIHAPRKDGERVARQLLTTSSDLMNDVKSRIDEVVTA